MGLGGMKGRASDALGKSGGDIIEGEDFVCKVNGYVWIEYFISHVGGGCRINHTL